MSNEDMQDAVAMFNELCDAGYTPSQAAQMVDESFGLSEE
jgi:hypothetical protein